MKLSYIARIILGPLVVVVGVVVSSGKVLVGATRLLTPLGLGEIVEHEDCSEFTTVLNVVATKKEITCVDQTQLDTMGFPVELTEDLAYFHAPWALVVRDRDTIHVYSENILDELSIEQERLWSFFARYSKTGFRVSGSVPKDKLTELFKVMRGANICIKKGESIEFVQACESEDYRNELDSIWLGEVVVDRCDGEPQLGVLPWAQSAKLLNQLDSKLIDLWCNTNGLFGFEIAFYKTDYGAAATCRGPCINAFACFGGVEVTVSAYEGINGLVEAIKAMDYPPRHESCAYYDSREINVVGNHDDTLASLNLMAALIIKLNPFRISRETQNALRKLWKLIYTHYLSSAPPYPFIHELLKPRQMNISGMR
eukprot:GHVS01056683.1.p1 GENE.GHVS01056683.1~~GHVS01056683.1.p1  ORF type:complete len:369 (-),score=12.79 GHVS01056683.1:598-1704(-)